MLRLDDLDRRLRRRRAGVPVIVVRLPAVERLAWRAGRAQAQRLERDAVEAFAALASRVLRRGDLLAHDPGTDAFAAALAARPRAADAASPLDVRAAVARLADGMEQALRTPVAAGWSVHAARSEPRDPAALIERALRAGEEERTRFAFFAAIGHELRTPLAAVRGYLETALEEPDEAARTRFLAIAHRESLRLCRLVDGMFEISLLDLHPALGDGPSAPLPQVVATAATGCAASARARGVTVRVGSVPPLRVAAARDHLVLALLNLLENAVKHGRSGGAVDVSVRRERKAVRVLVDDDGSGIPPEQRGRIFAVGERGAASVPGTGIGLATTRLIVERIGGKVIVGSSPAGGARFVLILPRALARR